MNIARFFAADLTADSITLTAAEARHAAGSRRLRAGDEVELFDGRGAVARGRLLDSSSRVEITERRHDPPPAASLTLLVAAPKGERLRWMIEKCTELGVPRVVLTRFDRSIVRPGADKRDKLMRYAIEACKQCGRNHLPQIDTDVPFADALAGAGVASPPRRRAHAPNDPAPPAADGDARRILLADANPAAPSLAQWLAKQDARPRHISIFIGPEGGLTDAERLAIENANADAVRLAAHTLRTETAAIAAAAIFSADTS